MDSKIVYLIRKHTDKLENLIATNAPYNDIVKQSQKLDKYIMIQMKIINKVEVSH